MATPGALRILHITPYYSPAWAYGGSTRVAVELCTRLASRGHSVTVYTTDAQDAERRAEPGEHLIDGVAVRRFRNLSNRLAWGRMFVPLGFGQAVARAVPTFDVVHLHEVRSLLNVWALPALLRSSVPVVVSPHGGLPLELGRASFKRAFDALYGRRLLARACRLHALSGMEHEQALAFGLPAERVALIPNGIDAGAFDAPADVDSFKRRYDIPFASPVVGFLGRLNAIKGLDFLLDAFARILAARPDAILLLAGPDDGARPGLEAQAERLGIAPSVRFTGMLTDEADKAAAYRASSVYVLPARYEILSLTILEALLNATPCILTNRCALAGQLAGAGVARVVPFGDTSALTAEIAAVLDDPDTAHAEAGRGRQLVVEQFDWESVVDRWLEVYRACLEDAKIGG